MKCNILYDKRQVFQKLYLRAMYIYRVRDEDAWGRNDISITKQ